MSNDSVDVERRRKGSGPVGRADAPRRDLEGGQGGGLPPFGGNRPSFGGMPTRCAQMGGCGTLIVVLLLVGYYLLSGGQGVDLGASTDQTATQDYSRFKPTEAALPQSNFTPPVPAAASGQS